MFDEVDGQTDTTHNSAISMLLRRDLHGIRPRKPVVVNGDINPVADGSPVVHTSPIHRGKYIGNKTFSGVLLLLLLL